LFTEKKISMSLFLSILSQGTHSWPFANCDKTSLQTQKYFGTVSLSKEVCILYNHISSQQLVTSHTEQKECHVQYPDFEAWVASSSSLALVFLFFICLQPEDTIKKDDSRCKK
jgi:hypothetical protein